MFSKKSSCQKIDGYSEELNLVNMICYIVYSNLYPQQCLELL